MILQRCIVFVFLLVAMVIMAGCASSHESDMPWNTPQPWEGTIGLPGFSPSDR
jgi:hypothetical protein